MDKKNIFIKIKELLYNNYSYIYILTIICLISKKYIYTIMYKTPDLNIFKLLYFIVFMGFWLGLGLQLVLGNFNKYDIYILLIISAIYFITKEKTLLIFFILSIGARNIKDCILVKTWFITSLILYISIIILHQSGFMNSDGYFAAIRGGGEVTRYSLGFGNPNQVFFYAIPIISAILYLTYEKYNTRIRLTIVIITIILYAITYSRTALATIISTLIILELIRFIKIEKLDFFKKNALSLAPIIITILSLIIAKVFENNKLFNLLLSGRPRFWGKYIGEISITGKIKVWNGQLPYPLDNSYIYIIIVGGILTWLMFMWLMYKGIKATLYQNDISTFVALLLFLMYSVGENILIATSFNFPMILILKKINYEEVFKKYRLKLRRRV